MNYIVMDLEWNQPVSFHSSAYKEIGEQLLFEIIQIGAVKLNKHFKIAGEIDILISPTYYKRLHPYVRRMTHLSSEELESAPAFAEGMQKFLKFCGPDAVLLTWGADDVSVLKQNAECFAVPAELPKTYNLQRYFADAFHLGNSQKSLKAAMEQLGIEEEAERAFHHAMHDAYYTALVFKKLPDPAKVLDFEQQPRKLCRAAEPRRFRITHTVASVAAGLKHKDVMTPSCPACKQPAGLVTELTPQAPGRYVALCNCKKHGHLLVTVRFTQLSDKQKGMNVSVTPASRQTRAYVHTKVLQYQYKRKNGYVYPDPEDLSQVTSFSMPFDE
jgi:DNA polymerase III epsilon subunit-like protein